MRAIRVQEVGGPEVLRVEDVPEPTPGPGELLVQVEAVGIKFLEIYQRMGAYPMALPYTPGTEMGVWSNRSGKGSQGSRRETGLSLKVRRVATPR